MRSAEQTPSAGPSAGPAPGPAAEPVAGPASAPVLSVRSLSAWYGEAQALRGVSIEVPPGQIVTLVGRNGAGKSTTLRCIMGLHTQAEGQVVFQGEDISRLPPQRRARLGLGYVPEERGIYSRLTVEENLLLPPTVGPDAWSLDRIYSSFPSLKERRRHPGSKLSGGEQQMLAIARVLRMGARLLLLDEPTEGLAPLLVQQLADLIMEAKQHGATMLLVEQNLRFATAVADRHYLLAQGQIVDTLTSAEVQAREAQILKYLGV